MLGVADLYAEPWQTHTSNDEVGDRREYIRAWWCFGNG